MCETMRMLPRFRGIGSHTVFADFSDPFLLDIGANHGGFVRGFREAFGGRAILVEPSSVLCEELRAVGAPVLRYALTTTDGPVTLNLAKNDEGSSILILPNESPWGCTLVGREAVEGRTLRSILSEINEPRIDVLKLDAEGAEVLVLPTLTQEDVRNVGQITVEFHCHPIFGFGGEEPARRARQHLRRLGFVEFDFSARRHFSWEDVLFVNRRMYDVSALQWIYWQQVARVRQVYQYT